MPPLGMQAGYGPGYVTVIVMVFDHRKMNMLRLLSIKIFRPLKRE